MCHILLIKGSICSWKRVFKLPFQLFFPDSGLCLLLGILSSGNYSVLDQDLPVNFGKITQTFQSTFGSWQPGVQQGRISTRWEPLNSNGCWPLWQLKQLAQIDSRSSSWFLRKTKFCSLCRPRHLLNQRAASMGFCLTGTGRTGNEQPIMPILEILIYLTYATHDILREWVALNLQIVFCCLHLELNFAFAAYRSQKSKLFLPCSQPDLLPDLWQIAFQEEIKRKKKVKIVLELAPAIFSRFKKSEILKSEYVLCKCPALV